MNSVTLGQLLTNQTTNTASTRIGNRFLERAFNHLCLDSRMVQENDIFVLLRSETGTVANSAHYLQQVIGKTAFVLSEIDLTELIEAEPSLQEFADKICAVAELRLVLGDIIKSYKQYAESAELPQVVAVTGTNGKTTISQLVAQLLCFSGKTAAVMGTAGNGQLGQLEQASHTTGDVLAVQSFLHKMAMQNVDVLSLEASSHGLYQHRLQSVPVQVAIYTNLSRDHLDYHSDMEDYAHAKARLFDKNYFNDLTHAIINLDDDYADIMLATAQTSDVEHIWTYTLDETKEATFVADSITPSLAGVEITIALADGIADDVDSEKSSLAVSSPLLGRFNVANLLAAIAAALALGIKIDDMAHLVSQLQGADGRMDRVASSKGCFIVDYAHTPDALTQVLKSLKAHCDGELWAVFGCGGDRDKGKRPLMAQAGLLDADKVVLTSDNPRSENPDTILEDMQEGMTEVQYAKTHIEVDRQKAIAYVVKHAQEADIVVIAGKGHETYQEINGVRYDFDDKKVLASYLNA